MSGLLWNKLSKCILNQTERKRKTTTIIVGSSDQYNQLGEKPNNKNVNGSQIIRSSSEFCHSILLHFCLTQFALNTLCWSQEAVHCLELATTEMAEPPILSGKQKSVSSLSFQSKTTTVASLLRFPPSAVNLALFTCFRKSAVMGDNSSTAIKI